MNTIRKLLIGAYLALAYAFVTSGCASTPNSEIFGAKSASTMKITVNGEGILNPGIYHIEEGTSLADLILKAMPSRISDKRFTITRIVDGYERSFGFRLNTEKTPSLPVFPLRDGDFIYASIHYP